MSILLVVACSNDEQVKSTLSLVNGNVLLPMVSFTVDEGDNAYVEYWMESDSINRLKTKIITGKIQNHVLVNVSPETNYRYVIKILGSERYSSQTFHFRTSSVPESVVRTKKVLIDTTQLRGYILVRSVGPLGSDAIINKRGDVVWYHQYDTIIRRPFYWTKRNTVLSLYDSSIIMEVGLNGDKILNIDLEKNGVNKMMHHDIIENSNREIISLTHDSLQLDLRQIGGKMNQYLRADGILVLNRSGQKIWEWNILDVHNPIKDPIGAIDLKQSLGHANSITVDRDGNYLVSMRDFAQIWKIDASSGKVIWKLGKGGDFKMDSESYFINQHSIYKNSNDELMVFDNGDRTRSFSRVLSFEIDEQNMKATTQVNVKLPTELSAPKMCNAETIENGNFLICTSKRSGVISVVNKDGEILWRVNLTSPSYRAYYIKNPFGNLVTCTRVDPLK